MGLVGRDRAERRAREKPWTQRLWIYDFRTNQRFTLKERPLKDDDLKDFVAVAKLSERHARQASDRLMRTTRRG